MGLLIVCPSYNHQGRLMQALCPPYDLRKSMKCRLVPFGRGLLIMKKSPAALESRPSNSQQQIISSSGVQACAKHRSTCTALCWSVGNHALKCWGIHPICLMHYSRKSLEVCMIRVSLPFCVLCVKCLLRAESCSAVTSCATLG